MRLLTLKLSNILHTCRNYLQTNRKVLTAGRSSWIILHFIRIESIQFGLLPGIELLGLIVTLITVL